MVFSFQCLVPQVEFAQATPLAFPVCSTTHGSQIDKWTMDHMETHKPIHQEELLKINHIFCNNQDYKDIFYEANCVPHFLNEPYHSYPNFILLLR